MARKISNVPVRNEERTKANPIAVFGKILKEDGFAGLSISRVEEEAKVGGKLIYDH